MRRDARLMGAIITSKVRAERMTPEGRTFSAGMFLDALAAAGFEVVPSDVADLGRAVRGTKYTAGSTGDHILAIIYAEAGVERPS